MWEEGIHVIFFLKYDVTKGKYCRLRYQRAVCYELHTTKESLQEQIDKVNDFCTKWKVDINTKNTKIMIFKRGNKLIKSNFYVKGKLLENVKTYKYLGFTISAKQCSFAPTI